MSVKTGAVGSNPKIDKLMNADSGSLRRYAATVMVNHILTASNDAAAGNKPETGKGKEDEAYAADGEAGRKAIRANRAVMSQPELPEEGIYVKDIGEGNVIQRYKKMVDERLLQMEAAATLAFAEDQAMLRNGIPEEERKEFFADYLSQESEYLVEGAMLTCSQADNAQVYIDDPENESKQHIITGDSSKTENPLERAENPANDGAKKYATVSDSIKEANIGIFRNCLLTNSSPDSKAKALGELDKCREFGTCYALMDLCDEWVNVKEGAVYGKAGEDLKNCINMLSHLGCYQGGMIFPLDTGQGELEEEAETVNKEDIISKNDYLTQEEMEINARYIYNFFTEAGWSHNAICGLLGNMEVESNLSPEMWYDQTEGSVAVGLSQWNPSEDYLAWADENNFDPFDMDVQLNRILSEVEGTIYQWQSFKHESDMSFEAYTQSEEPVEYLSEVYLRCYERPKITQKTIDERAENAIKWSDYLK